MSSEDKPEERPTPAPPPVAADAKNDKSSPSLEELDSAWGEEEEFDEDATMVAKVPHDLVALSRRGTELQESAKATEAPEKHEAITARPPPAEPAVVVDVPHEQLPPNAEARAARDEDDDEDEEDEEDELAADDLDAGWDIEEERAAAADVAAGLDAEARRKAAEARAVVRKEKGRAKALAAKEKRRARAEAIRQKQKQKKKRSIPPPRATATGGERPAASPSKPLAKRDSEPPATSRTRRTDPPKAIRVLDPAAAARQDMLRMVLIVAIVVMIGALAIGLMRR